MKWRREERESNGAIPLRRGIAILPSVLTLANMFCGYMAIVASSRQDFDLAIWLIVIAVWLDGLDGRIARMTRTTSEFGVELDSLTDFLSFGVAPALILFHWGFVGPSQPEWLARTGSLFPFLLPVAGAIRLARFNIQSKVADKRFFAGLPIPAAAGAAVLPLWYLPQDLPEPLKLAALVYVVLLSMAMISKIRWRSFKEVDMRKRRTSYSVFTLAVLFVLIAVRPKPVLLSIAITYALWGPIASLVNRLRPIGKGEAA